MNTHGPKRDGDAAIERECERCVLAVLYGLDEFDYDLLLAQFCKDGVWHRRGAALTGHAAIRASMEQRPRTQRVRHLMSNFMLRTIGADGPAASFYMTAYQHDSGAEAPLPRTVRGALGIFVGQVRWRSEAGVWRIVELTLQPEFRIE